LTKEFVDVKFLNVNDNQVYIYWHNPEDFLSDQNF